MDTTYYPDDLPNAAFTSQSTKKSQTCNDIPKHALNLNLELRKSASIHDFLKGACTKSIFTHVLFSRGIIPSPAEQILKIADNIVEERNQEMIGAPATGRKRKRMDTVRKRKYEKHGGQIRSVLNALDTLFALNPEQMSHEAGSTQNSQSSECKAVLITIGPSFSSPREQYLIRFHSWKSKSRQLNSTNHASGAIPSAVQQRLSREMGRRSVRELICGSLQEEYTGMFEIKSVGMDSMKVNVACLVSQDGVQRLLNSSHSADVHQFNAGEISTHGNLSQILNQGFGQTPLLSKEQMPFSINHRLEVKEPRMYSKSRGLHRPFAVLNVVPALRPPGCRDDEVPGFEQEDRDTWVSLRPFVKAFRI